MPFTQEEYTTLGFTVAIGKGNRDENRKTVDDLASSISRNKGNHLFQRFREEAINNWKFSEKAKNYDKIAAYIRNQREAYFNSIDSDYRTFRAKDRKPTMEAAKIKRAETRRKNDTNDRGAGSSKARKPKFRRTQPPTPPNRTLARIANQKKPNKTPEMSPAQAQAHRELRDALNGFKRRHGIAGITEPGSFKPKQRTL